MKSTTCSDPPWLPVRTAGMGMLPITRTWTDAITRWDVQMRAAGRPASTRTLRAYHLRRLGAEHRGRGPWDLQHDDLLTWLADKPWAAETRRSYRASLRLFYGWAHATGRIPADPAYGLPAITPPRRMPRPAPDAVVCDALQRAGVRERLMVLVLVETGMRRAEVAQLHTADVHADPWGWSLRVRGKGARDRVIPLSEDLARVLRLVPGGWVFPGRIDGHLSPRRVGELVSDALGGGWTAHTLRHRFATLAYSVERDLRAVQELLGHSKPETTAVYTLVPDGARRRAAAGAGRGVLRQDPAA